MGGLTSLFGAGGGGFSGSSEANSSTGSLNFGGFTFSPKANSGIPPIAYVIAGIAVVVLLLKR